MNYSDIHPIDSRIAADRQGVKRHYGVHPYFTRRPYNVVRHYILHYSAPGDRVLDPFGGSGVTAIEAFLENRVGIQNDINPLANFIACGVVDLANGDVQDLQEAVRYVEERCRKILCDIEVADNGALDAISKDVRLPENVTLPKTSDVQQYWDLFSRKQLLSLAVLKTAIDKIQDPHARNAMLLAWSATLTKLNRTFLSAEGRAASRGGSSIFSIYRYKIARKPIELPAWNTWRERANNIINAKIEVLKTIEVKQRSRNWSGKFCIYSEDAESLGDRFAESIDYIFTDPPYGGHISYLDLSTLWNVWLDILPSQDSRQREIIVGGELDFSEAQYIERLGGSIRSCIRMLRQDRWCSVVFQHWSARYFEAILSSAQEAGAELKAAVSQVGDPIWSMHKKKNKDSVLAGELILTFYKSANTRKVKKTSTFDVGHIVDAILKEAKNGHIFGEYLFNRVIVEAWQSSAIHLLQMSKDDFSNLLQERGWYYDDVGHYWRKERPQRDPLFEAKD